MIFGQPFGTQFDMLPATTQYKTYSLDAIMANVSTVPYESDIILQSKDTKTYSIDAIMERVEKVIYQTDLLLAANNTQTYQMAGRIKSDLHLSFYVMDGAVMKCNVRAYYRMGGLISNLKYSQTKPQRTAFSARQSLIIPEDINSDDVFDLADRRVAVAANKNDALKQSR